MGYDGPVFTTVDSTSSNAVLTASHSLAGAEGKYWSFLKEQGQKDDRGFTKYINRKGSYTCSENVIELENSEGASGTAALRSDSDRDGILRVFLEDDDWGMDYFFSIAGVD